MSMEADTRPTYRIATKFRVSEREQELIASSFARLLEQRQSARSYLDLLPPVYSVGVLSRVAEILPAYSSAFQVNQHMLTEAVALNVLLKLRTIPALLRYDGFGEFHSGGSVVQDKKALNHCRGIVLTSNLSFVNFGPGAFGDPLTTDGAGVEYGPSIYRSVEDDLPETLRLYGFAPQPPYVGREFQIADIVTSPVTMVFMKADNPDWPSRQPYLDFSAVLQSVDSIMQQGAYIT